MDSLNVSLEGYKHQKEVQEKAKKKNYKNKSKREHKIKGQFYMAIKKQVASIVGAGEPETIQVTRQSCTTLFHCLCCFFSL